MSEHPPIPPGQKSEDDLKKRRDAARDIRDKVSDIAESEFETTVPPANGDEQDFAKAKTKRVGFASFTKALPHDDKGQVDKKAFDKFLAAVESGTQTDFNKVPLGGKRKLVNPLNAYSYQLIGNDSNGARMAPAPKFNSRNTAVDMVERYWMALCRDIPFDQYANSPLIKAACEDLENLGFKQEFGFSCTPETIFRGPYEGCDVGPHVSQFLLQDFLFGNQRIRQRQRYPKAGLDYMTDLESWSAINNGTDDPTGDDVIEGSRYITTLRDAGQWVHIDLPHQSGLWATLALLERGVAQTKANPYANDSIPTSEAFGSLGGPDLTIQSGLAGVYGLKHAWFQKWCVHRRLRPEVYAQRLELFRRGDLGSSPHKPFNDAVFKEIFGDGADVWCETTVLKRIFEHNKQQNIAQNRGDRDGSWLLPMAFPEGSPTHPAYPGGHSVFIAAAATIAKAFFKDVEFPCPKQVSDGSELLNDYHGEFLTDYKGEPLTVHGELNKLIANITLFRDGAGMHWRTDGTATGPNANTGCSVAHLATGGNILGEKLAVSMLRDIKETYRESVGTFKFDGLDGKCISI
ncbi:MAG: phosphatidic acid phosphatase [Cyanobacteria bacterium P01_D01_bin.36]